MLHTLFCKSITTVILKMTILILHFNTLWGGGGGQGVWDEGATCRVVGTPPLVAHVFDGQFIFHTKIAGKKKQPYQQSLHQLHCILNTKGARKPSKYCKVLQYFKFCFLLVPAAPMNSSTHLCRDGFRGQPPPKVFQKKSKAIRK